MLKFINKVLHKLILCRIGRHQRSWRHAHNWGDGPYSRCEYCGIPMKRINEGGRRWIVDEAALDRNSDR
jgi:hypothetical protein